MQTDVWMFRAQTMKMAGVSFDHMHRNRPWEALPAILDGLWESKHPHARTFFGAATCPVQNDVINCTDIWMFRAQTINEDGRGKLRPHASEQTLGGALRNIRRPVGKQTSTCTDVFWGSDMPSAK